MKLLFDHNLSPKLVERLADVFPQSEHVARVGLASASDFEVWDYAKKNSLTIVSKDSDLSEIGMVRGFPPRIVWIRRGNCTTSDIESLLRQSLDSIFRLGSSAPFGILILA